ncbi:MAG: hypothetical protein M3R51_03755 [Candidatus Eremiobacteraeota bacterium]|nr:hypothetical protein [Candidatus Eremiobacteraeota bacterium]
MHDHIFELPEPAQRLVHGIEGTIDEARPLFDAAGAPPEIAFNLTQTRSKYLPDTVRAYCSVPLSQREFKDENGRTALDSLLEQLSVLDRAVKRDLEALTKAKRHELAANARFLAERFDDRSTEISDATASAAPLSQTPAGLRNWLPADESDGKGIVAYVGGKFAQAFPGLTELRYAGMFGMGSIESVRVTVQQGGGVAFRYMLGVKSGILESSVSKVVHGTPIQTVQCPVEDWLQSLYDDISEQARHHAEMRSALARLLQ